MDTSHLLILRNPYKQFAKLTLRHPNCLPNLRLQTAPSQTALYTLSQITAEAAERGNCARNEPLHRDLRGAW